MCNINLIYLIYIDIGVSRNGGVPPNGWFIMENPKQKWMKTRGTPVSGNLHSYFTMAKPIIIGYHWIIIRTCLENNTGRHWIIFNIIKKWEHKDFWIMLNIQDVWIVLNIFGDNTVLPLITLVVWWLPSGEKMANYKICFNGCLVGWNWILWDYNLLNEIYPLVICNIAIENDHLVRWFIQNGDFT